MIKYKFSNDPDRSQYLDKIKDLSVIDIGGATSFADGHLTAIVDFSPPLAKSLIYYPGNINDPETWAPVLNYVKKKGKFDYSICTHTIEDISNPLFVCKQIEKISKRGLIIVPSKFIEFNRFNYYRGFIHHRFIFDIIDGELTGFPKLNLIEHPRFDSISGDAAELVVEWEEEIGLKIINGDFLGPDNQAVENLYSKLL